jgi:hypothetical protein
VHPDWIQLSPPTAALPPAWRSSELLDVVRYATMAASSHNSQPWKFARDERSISILPDFSRRCPVVDPDDHHLFVSVGCAAENLVDAALAAGLHGHVDVEPDGVRISLECTKAVTSPSFEAIPHRQCSRSIYDGKALSTSDVDALHQAARGDGVETIFLSATKDIDAVLDFVTRGNCAQIGDPAFLKELVMWIRFNGGTARRTGDGLYWRSIGSPSLPDWLGRLLLRKSLTPAATNDKSARQLKSSAGVFVFVSSGNDRRHWVEVGRSYERVALRATVLGIRNAFLNQPVEVQPLRSQFATWLGIGDRRADLIVRVGGGPAMRRSFRRPVAHVLI